MSSTDTERRLRLIAVWWYVLGWIPCLALNGIGVPGKICLGFYAAFGMVVFMVGMSIDRERAAAAAARLDRPRPIESDDGQGS
jgi:hypothetical protein